MAPKEHIPFNLMARVNEALRHAVKRGAVQPIRAAVELVVDGPARFLVRTTEAPEPLTKIRDIGPADNPFLPYNKDAFVCDLSDTHVCLLNKYPVVPHHLLLITRQFEPQESLLTIADFQAMVECLSQLDGLGFYNSGPHSGASQPHKHLQFTPFPLVIPGALSPPVLGAPLDSLWCSEAPMPFQQWLMRLPTDWFKAADAASKLHSLYLGALEELNLASRAEDARQDRPRGDYNLLMTREFFILVPRRRAEMHSISLNGLGYAGAILARGQKQRQALLAEGPMAALRGCAFTRP